MSPLQAPQPETYRCDAGCSQRQEQPPPSCAYRHHQPTEEPSHAR
ncbi:MAG: hypothetical protein AVDCRST_MAG09-1226 [uncultured Sphingomonas sp.]|uniref:Uncharacterized protein n=1 Tax=uncultured Sphingomonas sp. TaxID=158754 RepID=A0A6J4SYI2_9SPHN|nr:MAG: hypothetical protein AVDCRST_MAG09-1226 [uncultured Sphingomonas sp.]